MKKAVVVKIDEVTLKITCPECGVVFFSDIVEHFGYEVLEGATHATVECVKCKEYMITTRR